jgi:hypothetical protein
MKDEKDDLRGRLLAESGAVKPTKLASLLDETSQLTAILTAITKKVRARC